MCPNAKGTSRQTVQDILPEMQKSTFPAKTDLEKGHSAAEIAKRHALPEILVWTIALDLPGRIFAYKIFRDPEGRGDVFHRDLPGEAKRYE